MSAFVAVGRPGYSTSEDADIVSVVDGKGAGEVAAASQINNDLAL